MNTEGVPNISKQKRYEPALAYDWGDPRAFFYSGFRGTSDCCSSFDPVFPPDPQQTAGVLHFWCSQTPFAPSLYPQPMDHRPSPASTHSPHPIKAPAQCPSLYLPAHGAPPVHQCLAAIRVSLVRPNPCPTRRAVGEARCATALRRTPHGCIGIASGVTNLRGPPERPWFQQHRPPGGFIPLPSSVWTPNQQRRSWGRSFQDQPPLWGPTSEIYLFSGPRAPENVAPSARENGGRHGLSEKLRFRGDHERLWGPLGRCWVIIW